MTSTRDKISLIIKISALEKFMYTHKDLACRAIGDYESCFGCENCLYSEKLSRTDGFDHTLRQFSGAIGFIYMDIAADLQRTKIYTPDNSDIIDKYNQFQALSKDVIIELRQYTKQ
jgi:hypothetical protein